MDRIESSFDIPLSPPFALRARILSPQDSGGYLEELDGIVLVNERGRITWAGPMAQFEESDLSARQYDLRPLLLLPGLIDMHAHLPQVPIMGRGFGMRLEPWLREIMRPVEQSFDAEISTRMTPRYLREFSAAGTTLACFYGNVDAGATEAAFSAVEQHGMRVIMGQALMDKDRYDHVISDHEVTDLRLREAADTCSRWHGKDEGRILYAFTPRSAHRSSREMMRESAHMAQAFDCHWQTHIAEDPDEPAAITRAFPESRDFLDVYERAGGLGPKSIFAHAVYLSDSELRRLSESRSTVAHCPVSNIFLGHGIMALSRYRELFGLRLGLGSDVAGGFSCSLFVVMQIGALCQTARRLERDHTTDGRFDELSLRDWLQLATLDGARCLQLDDQIGSIEAGKDADMILVDPLACSPPSDGLGSDMVDLDSMLSRMIFRPHPDAVRASWVRGRRLPGPAGWNLTDPE